MVEVRVEQQSLNIVLWIVNFVFILLKQLDIIPNNIGMANVSSVPLSYIF